MKQNTRKVALWSTVALTLVVLPCTDSMAQVGSKPLVKDYIVVRGYSDKFQEGKLANSLSFYPSTDVQVLASGDSHVSSWGPLIPWLTGVTTFEDPNHPNCDPNVLVGAYNYANTTGGKINPLEPCGGINLETNYLVPDTYYRQMEWYLTFRTTAGNPGLEYRPINVNYAPDTGEVTGVAVSAASQRWGANFEWRSPTGGTAGERFAQIGWTNQGGGNICGFQHLGSPVDDTVVDIQAQGLQNSRMQIGSHGVAGVGRWSTLSTNQCSFSVGSADDLLRLFDTGAGSGGALAINMSSNGQNAGLAVASSTPERPTIVGRGISGQSAPLLRLVDSTNTDPINNTGEVYSIDSHGYQYTKVATLNAGQGQSAATITTPFADIVGGNGSRGATLPVPTQGMLVRGFIDGSNATMLYPSAGCSINGGSVNSGITVGARKPFTAIALDSSRWSVQIGA